jgi:pyruvate-formate lyase-activating enzyme
MSPTAMSNDPHTVAPTRVLVVDCYANDRVFIRDTLFGALDGELRAAGFDVVFRELVRDDPPAGKAIRDVLRTVVEQPPGLIVLSRAWGAELVQSLRAAAGPSAAVVRHSHGPPSPLDAIFDAVLDARGIVAFLCGESDRAAPHWRRSKREMAEVGAASVEASIGDRPTISGPAKGCPFLVDVRASPAYRDADIDFDQVQTKGCSFCLDNVGAFAAFPEEEVVASWLTQLRAVRRVRPNAREILLTDERPHPYLPALFRAVLDDPSLHGIELLIKSRVDWLAEYADGAVRDACDLAAASGSVLHIYLVGFESFHQADLDLFNKAVSVADNVRAVELLRVLERRHPEAFEYRRHRAHGIVLFHPWTTLEGLLANARVMREVGFHELRSQALRTRLRLYGSVPLHALAERQCLLIEHFDEGRGDRAVEQGYDASVPWKFADSRIEAVYRAANAVADAFPQLSEADILEASVRFVTRWPVFATAPDLAALPIVQALYTWGASPDEVLAVAGPAVASFDREVEAVAAGEKAGSLKESVPRGEAEALVAAYRTMGLAASIVSTHARGGADGQHDRGDSHAIVAVARDDAALAVVERNQRAVERGEFVHIPAMGVLMGYPPCCVAAFAAHRAHGDNLDLERAPFRAAPEHALHPLVNRFGAVSLLSHMLCTPDCAASIALAQRRLATVRDLDGAAADRIAAELRRPVLRLDYERAVRLEGEWRGERFVVAMFSPLTGTSLGVEPHAVVAVRFDDGQVLVELTGGEQRRISAPSAILVEPGGVLAPAVLRFSEDRGVAARPHAPGAAPDGPIAADIAIALAPGTEVEDGVIETTDGDGAGGLRVGLCRKSGALTVRVRPWSPSRPTVSRRGAWALDLDDDRPPTDAERAVLGALARLLPAGRRSDGGDRGPSADVPIGTAGGAPKREVVGGVVCTAPWTTLEIVDPDGLVRQCCADWTAGDRGSLRGRSLMDVWNGDGYRAARRVMSGRDLSSLCHSICPRLYDGKFAERELSIVPGAEAFVRNQQILLDDIAERRELVRARPLYVAICPSTYCNYDCIMCLHGRTPRRDLDEGIWDELPALLPSLRVLTLLGGEPLASPAAMRFLRAWDRHRYPDAAVSIVTNGSLLGTGALAHLDRCNFGNVTISLNAGTPEVYERVQRGIALESVMANIDALVELRRRQGSTFPIVLSFVVQPSNHTTLLAFGEIARSRGLAIRLMPLSPEGVEELDFYGDDDEVARVLGSLDAMANWAAGAAPQYLSEIRGTRGAIAGEASRRARTAADTAAAAASTVRSATSRVRR